ncbi:hypothetical protein [Streptomyces sp. PTD5-9]|uniref:hypothetical protein n=1 Tax=Streptomyces sp. PTD5-9 TaxID=3120150 RepID=UPI003009CCA3
MARERIQWRAVVDRARQIVESYEGGVALRQVMYRLVSEGMLPPTPSMYRHLFSPLAQARREGRFPDLIDTLREAVDWFALDRTEGQHPVYVAAEKNTLRQLLTGWLAEYGIRSRSSAASPPSPTPTSYAAAPPGTARHAALVRLRRERRGYGTGLGPAHRRLLGRGPPGAPDRADHRVRAALGRGKARARQITREEEQRRALAAFLNGWDAAGGEDRRSAVRAPTGSGGRRCRGAAARAESAGLSPPRAVASG